MFYFLSRKKTSVDISVRWGRAYLCHFLVLLFYFLILPSPNYFFLHDGLSVYVRGNAKTDKIWLQSNNPAVETSVVEPEPEDVPLPNRLNN